MNQLEQKRKVAEFVTRLELGGVEAVLLNYISHFEHRENFEFHIITQDINAEKCIKQFEKAGCIVHIVTHKRKSILKNVQEICRILREERFDVVHSHMTLTNFYVLILAWLAGVTIRISHSHNAFPETGWKQKLFFPMLKWLNRVSGTVWMACGCEAGAFLFGKQAMQAGKVHMMNNAIDVQKFQYDAVVRNRIRTQYKIGDSLCIGHVGRFMEQKNHKYLIDIFTALHRKRPDTKLLLVGSGELEAEVRQYAAQQGLRDAVIFAGYVTNSHEFYQAMDLFLLPSLYEGLPVVSIEAQAAGLQCLISDNVDKSCALTDSVQFLSVELPPEQWADMAISLLGKGRNSNVAAQIAQANYSIETEAQKLEALYSGHEAGWGHLKTGKAAVCCEGEHHET